MLPIIITAHRQTLQDAANALQTYIQKWKEDYPHDMSLLDNIRNQIQKQIEDSDLVCPIQILVKSGEK